MKELIIHKDPDLLDSFLDVGGKQSSGNCITLRVLFNAEGGDGIPTGYRCGCEEAGGEYHGGCLVS